LYIGIGNNIIPRSVVQVQERKKNPREIRRGLNIAILLIITPRSILPLLLTQGFVAVVTLVEISVTNMLIPLFLVSIGPKEKEPPDGFF
jgi:hypothetical protein